MVSLITNLIWDTGLHSAIFLVVISVSHFKLLASNTSTIETCWEDSFLSLDYITKCHIFLHSNLAPGNKSSSAGIVLESTFSVILHINSNDALVF